MNDNKPGDPFDYAGTAEKIGDRLERAAVHLGDGRPHTAARCLREAAELCDAFGRASEAEMNDLRDETGV